MREHGMPRTVDCGVGVGGMECEVKRSNLQQEIMSIDSTLLNPVTTWPSSS